MNASFERVRSRRATKLLVGGAALVVLLLGLFVFRNIVLVALVGVIMGVLIEPLIRAIQRRTRLPHGVSVLLAAVGLLVVALALGWGVYLAIAEQIGALVKQGPAITGKLNRLVEGYAVRFSWLGLDPAQIDVGALVRVAGQTLLKGLSLGLEGLAGALVIFMIAIFTAGNSDAYLRGALTLFPLRLRPRVDTLAHESAQVVRRWFTSQMLVVTISGILTAIAMAAIGVDYWLLIALMTIVLDFVPFLGAIVTALVAAMLTLGTEPEKVWWVLLAFVIIQQLESDVIMPMVMKERIRLPEAHLLVFLLVMGTAFGVLGVFISPPLFAVMHHLYLHTYVPWIEAKPG